MFNFSWQLNEDRTPFFIKYGYVWGFSGLPKDQRTEIISQTWDLVKHNYDENHYNDDKLARRNILQSICKYTKHI